LTVSGALHLESVPTPTSRKTVPCTIALVSPSPATELKSRANTPDSHAYRLLHET
jgi:hypothetical protein